MWRPLVICMTACAGLVGCGVGPRRPLFSFDSTPSKKKPAPPPELTDPRTAGPVTLATPAPAHVPEIAVPATRSLTREEIDAIVEKVRHGRRAERGDALRRLVALGERARDDLERASEDATFETDLLREALLRIDEAAEPRPAPDRKRPTAATWVDAKYRLALDKFLAGDSIGALAVLDAVLLLEPSSQARPRLERLRRQVRDQLIADTVIAATIVPEEAVLAPGRPLAAKVVLENRCREEVVLRPAAGSPLGAVVVDYEELKTDGTRTLRRATRPVAGAAEIRLAPGARKEVAIDLPTEHRDKAKGVIGRYRLSGRLRPYTLLAGEEPLPYFIPLPLLEVVVLDVDELALAAKPEETFDRAVRAAIAAREAAREQDLREAFIAAVAWASAKRDEAIAGIVKALERAEGRLARTLCAALARATGEPGSYTKDEWLTWWKTNRARPRIVHAPDEDE